MKRPRLRRAAVPERGARGRPGRRRRLEGIESVGGDGEVVVVDNGSTDRSPEIAEEHGARVVHEPRRGYGSAYLRGLAEARGETS